MTLSMKTSLSVEKPGKNTDLSTKTGHFVEKVGRNGEKVGRNGYCAMKR